MNNKALINRRTLIVGSVAAVVGASTLGILKQSNVAEGGEYIMTKGKWIWCKNPKAMVDDYASFIVDLNLESSKNITLEIACDGIYSAYVNDNLAYFAQCSDFPGKFKLYDQLDISKYCKTRINKLRIDVWHGPSDAGLTYKTGPQGLLFQVFAGKLNADNIVAYSNAKTQSRVMTEYENGYKKTITGQMGFSYHYLNPKDFTPVFSDSQEVQTQTSVLHKREILPMVLGQRLSTSGEISWKYTTNNESILVEWKKETVGFLELDFISSQDQKITIAYGEHTVNDDGTMGEHVRKAVGGRDFTYEFSANKGSNNYINPFRRLAGRYLEIFAEKELPELDDITYIGVRPTLYPLEEIPYKADLTWKQNVYDASKLTLQCCMHEHYEDCPWREQGLYGMDSRNQMLCGYYAFRGHEFQRHCLKVLSYSMRNDLDLFDITAPCDLDRPIPFFSLAFVLALCEYIEHTNDKSILTDLYFKNVNGTKVYAPDLIMQYVANRIATDSKGLMPVIEPDPPFWNFYEWQPGGTADQGVAGGHDLNMNAMYVRVHEQYNSITGKTFTDIALLRSNIVKHLLDSTSNMYKFADNREGSSQLVNGMALLAGVDNSDSTLTELLVNDLEEKWDEPLKKTNMVTASLSMRGFVYDALIKKNKHDVVLQDIKYVYERMLSSEYFSGTVWEDEEGQKAFSNAGSLCHGWSALPIYYFRKYFS